ncbi:unnamed protein product [Meloidogyne enterolobii]|uniref:Uncharacterized protein n=1 Tax=Meloidogyne enterolobii TaxID=390850 RepID=A0ACB0YN88_MELEN
MADPNNLPPRPPQSVTPRTGVPQWSITRRERTEMTPPGRSSSRSGTEGGDSDSDSGGGIYRARTVTSTERVQIVQMPMELSQVSSEQLEMISLSPETEASREVCTTTTTIEAGAVPIVGGLTSSGVPIVSGIYLNRESRRTTTIITTTKTTYKILEDTSDDDLEFVQMPESTISTSTATTIKEKDDFLIINKTDSSITSTSEDDDNYDLKSSTSSLLLKQIPLKTKKDEDDEETVITTTNTTIDKLNENKKKEEEEIIVTSSNIVVIPSEIRSPPYSPHSFANTSTFSSPNSEGIMHTFDDEEFCAQLAKAAEASISPSFKTTTTKPVREISEEPLEHWVMLPDSQQQLKECSTQTTTEEIEENNPSTSCWNEAKSVEIDNYVNVYSNGYYSKLIEEDEGILNGTKRESPLANLFETTQQSQLEESQLDRHVNVYSSGYSDEIKPKTSKMREYPIEEPFIGNIYVLERNELKDLPLEVEKKHAGFYDVLPSTSMGETEKKIGTFEKLTNMFKGSKVVDDFPVDFEPFTGPIFNTNLISEAPNEYILSSVNVYSTGRSDEKTTVLTPSEFPKNEVPFIGTFSETNKSELETIPLEVERRHIGFYKNLEEEDKKPGALEKLTQIFKESKKIEEYPVKSDPFTGQVASTSVMIEAKNEPIHSMVSIYSSGRSDEAPTTKTTEFPVNESPFTGNVSESNRQLELTPILLEIEQLHLGYYDHLPSTIIDEEKKPGALEKLTQIFKRPKTEGDYPVDSEPYTGPLSSLNINSEAREEPIHSLVSVYSSGRYDEIPTTTKMNEFPINEAPYIGIVPEPRIVPELERIPLKLEKQFDLPRELPTELTEYPNFEEIFIGHIHELQRNEVENVPLEVEKKHIGFYEGTPSTSNEEKKHGTLEKLTRIFKGSKKSEEFPVDSEPFAGLIATTSSMPEAQTEPIRSLVSVYSSGHSNEQPLTKPTEYPQIEEQFTGHITESIKEAELGVQPLELERLHTGFDQNLPTIHSEMEHMPIGFEKKHIGYYEHLPSTSTKTSEYPRHEEPFIGHIHDLHQNEIDSVPIEVENKHVGYYEHLPSTTSKEEKKPGTLEKLTSLFKGSKTEGEFPVNAEPYSGPITLTNTDTDLTTEPIHSMVSIYSSGRSDEIHQSKSTEFPINETPFVDYVPESKLHSGMEHIPLDLEKKYIGYYEELPSTSTKTTEHPEPEQPFIGHIHSLQWNEVEVMTLEVENNYIGFYDHLPSTTLKEEKKPGTLEKLTKIFKGGKHLEEYPVDLKPYSGWIASTSTTPESKMEPLHSLVSVYSSGRSDEAPLSTKIPEYSKEQQYLGHVPDSSRQNELHEIPLEVERRHVGYYEHLPSHPKEDSKHHGALESLTHFFKSEPKHDTYPKDIDPFSGHLYETSRPLELTEAPIDNQVAVYSSGRSDEIPTKIIKISEFPINEDPFIGNTFEANKLEEIEGVPLEVEGKHVGYYEHLPPTTTKTSEYPKIQQPFIGHIHSLQRSGVEDMPMEVDNKHAGYYEHLPSLTVKEEKKPGALEKLTHIFKGSKTTEEFPEATEPYMGSLTSTNVAPEVKHQPILSMVGVYSSGIFEENEARKESEYPINEEPFAGNIYTLQKEELDEKLLEVEKKHIGFYEGTPSTSSEEKKHGTLEKLTRIFKGSKKSEEYLVDSEPFTGIIATTSSVPEAQTEPIHSFVTVYSSGRSEQPPVKTTEFLEEIASNLPETKVHSEMEHMPIEVERRHIGYYEQLPSIPTKTSEYPEIEQPFIGHIHSIRRNESEDFPMNIENKHIGFYEHHLSKNQEEKKTGALEKLTSLFIGSKTEGDFPVDSEPYSGPITLTNTDTDLTTEPIHSMVSIYSSGRYDEGQTTKHSEFPINEAPFVDYVPESKLHSGMEHIPLDLEKKYIGYYEQLPSTSSKTSHPEPEQPFIGHIHYLQRNEMEDMPMDIENKHIGFYEHLPSFAVKEEKKPGALEKLTKLFKGGKTLGEYPVDSEPFSGQIASTSLMTESRMEPISSLVSVYSSGRSDETPTTKITEFPKIEAPFIGNIPETKLGFELNSLPIEIDKKHIGFYEKSPPPLKKEETKYPKMEVIEDYSEPFTGTFSEITRHLELTEAPIDNQVAVYSSGRSDEIPTKIIKISEFPINEDPFIGNIFEANKLEEIEGVPLEVEGKHVGYYESLPSTTSEEEKKPGALEKLSHLFKSGESKDAYPKITAPYSGHVFESIHTEFTESPLEHHVSVYSSGETLEPPKILKTTEYPINEEPYFSYVPDSRRKNELNEVPLELENRHVGYYEHLPSTTTDGEEKKPGGTLAKLTQLFKGSRISEDFPIDKEAYTGHVSVTGTTNEATNVPIHSLVNIYSSGISDEHLTTKMAEFPKLEEPFIGYISETKRLSDLDPANFDVEMKNIGYYEHLPTSLIEEKHGKLDKLTQFFKRTKNVGDFPLDSEPYSGQIASTSTMPESKMEPIHSLVNVCSSGRSDEISSEIPPKIIKQTEIETQFATKVQAELEGIPLDIEKKHVGYYDQLSLASSMDEKKKPGRLEKLTKLFKRSKNEGEFPFDSEPFVGEIKGTQKMSELATEPIHSMVSIYSSGRSDEVRTTKITEFPINEAPFVGNVHKVIRHSEIETSPLEVEAQHVGYYEQLPSTSTKASEYPKLEESFIGHVHENRLQSELNELPLDVEKKHLGYYESLTETSKYPKLEQPFIGHIHDLQQNEIENVPIEVENKHVGYYEHHPSSTISKEEKKPGAIEKLTKLFKGSKTEEFPADSEPFDGYIANTNVATEAQFEPIHPFVSIYSSGRSDDVPTKMPEYPKIEVPFIGHVHESFRQSDLNSTPIEVEKRHVGYYEQLPSKVVETPSSKMTDFPNIEAQFIGNVPETSKRYDIHPVPFEVENNYIGYYEHLPLKIQEEKKPGALEKLTNLFKGSKKEGEFPTDSEPYFGPLKETKVVSEATGEPIHSLISVYSSGRSDKIPTARIPTESVEESSAQYLFETERNSELPEQQLNNIVNVYSSGQSDDVPTTKLTEFPINEAPFVGNVHEIKRQECETLPLEVEMKNVGYYEHLPSVTTREEEVKKPGLLDKISHLFKEDVTSSYYPQITAPFSGHIFETNRPTELYESGIDKHVNVYSSGRSDEIPKAVEYPTETSYVGHVSESKRLPEIDSVPLEVERRHIGYYECLPTTAEHSEKKLGTLEKLTQFLKGSKTTEEYLVDSEPYTGTVQRIEATSEVPNEPINAFVSIYSSGRSDEIHQSKSTEFPINEAPFVDYVPESKLQSGIEHIPLDLERKYIGYYEQLPSTSSKTFEHPEIEQPFIGHIHSCKLNEVETVPMEVENKHIGYYEHLIPTNDEEKKPGALVKLSKLFKGSKTDGDYPSDSEPYSGQISETDILPELPEQSLHSFANIYSSGRSDEIPSKQFPEHPKSGEIFIGNIFETKQISELQTEPLDIQNKHVGYYEKLPITSKKDEEEEKKPGAFEKLSLFFKGEETRDFYPQITG